MKKFSLMAILALATVFALGSLASAGIFGDKELDKEKLVIKFHREVKAGGYDIVDTETLKGWLDAKRPMIIVDTMPYEASYKKHHIPGAVQFEFPVKPLPNLSPAQQAKYRKF